MQLEKTRWLKHDVFGALCGLLGRSAERSLQSSVSCQHSAQAAQRLLVGPQSCMQPIPRSEISGRLGVKPVSAMARFETWLEEICRSLQKMLAAPLDGGQFDETAHALNMGI